MMFSLSYGKKWYLTHPWLLIKDITRNIKWAWQRVNRGWDDRDLWSLDIRICVLMEQWLNEFMEENPSYPAEFTHPNEWTNVIAAIRDGFIAGGKIANGDHAIYQEAAEEAQRRYGKNYTLQQYGYVSRELKVHIKIEKECKQYMITFDKGIELFHKYFFDLWT